MPEPRAPHPDAERHAGNSRPRARIEPVFDRSGKTAFNEREGEDARPRVVPVGPTQWWRQTWAGIVIAVALTALLLVLRQPLSQRLWPDTRAQQLRADAARALAQGTLSAADGQGARELYQAALALDPDRTDARAGLARVGQAALAQARRALAERRYPDAHRAVALARELAVPTTQVDAVAAALRQREAAEAGIERLLLQAIAANRTATPPARCGCTSASSACSPATRRRWKVARTRWQTCCNTRSRRWPGANCPRRPRSSIACVKPIPGTRSCRVCSPT